jgi:hypothetical protein
LIYQRFPREHAERVNPLVPKDTKRVRQTGF